MINEFFATLFFFIFILCGYVLSDTLFNRERLAVRLWFGGVIGLFLLIWVPALLAFLFDFTLGVQYLSLIIVVMIAVCVHLLTKKHTAIVRPKSVFDYKMLLALFPLMIIGVLLHLSHTIVEKDGALYVGQSTYGDLAMHLGFITSISVQKTFPPYYSICPDKIVGYPFLSDSVSSTLYTLTGNLRFSALLPACFAYVLVVVGVWFFFKSWLKENRKALFAVYLFYIGGGFGFAYFIDLLKRNPGNFSRIFTSFYETPTNYVSSGIKWVNPIADMLVPQRATLFGWTFLFPCLWLLFNLYRSGNKKYAIILGFLAGGLPLIHTHSFLALGIISGCYLIITVIKEKRLYSCVPYLIYLAIVIVFAGPQLIRFTFKQSQSFLCFRFNWANDTDSFIWFAVKNLGLLVILLIPAIIDTDPFNRVICSGAVLIWLIAEFIQFQPNPYDNNKLLFVSFAFLCGLVADYLIRMYQRLDLNATYSVKVANIALSCIVLITLFSSGILTLGREYVSEYMLIPKNEVDAAEYIKQNTEPSVTFLTHNNHNNSVAALTGRNIVCGTGSYLYYHGIDYAEREASLKRLFENPGETFSELSEKMNIDYVFLGNNEKWNYQIDYNFFENHCELVYDQNEVQIYRVLRDN